MLYEVITKDLHDTNKRLTTKTLIDIKALALKNKGTFISILFLGKTIFLIWLQIYEGFINLIR